MEYAYTISQDGDFYHVSCREIPELKEHVFKSEEDINKRLYTVFFTILEHFYRREGRPVPLPLPIGDSKTVIDVDGVLQAKILLWNYLQEQDLTVSWLSRKAGLSRQAAQRIIEFTNNGSFSKVEELLHAGVCQVIFPLFLDSNI